MEKTQRILIDDDHSLLRPGLRVMLTRNAEVEVLGASGRDAMTAYAMETGPVLS